MSNTVITNYTDLNGPSTKADNSLVVIVNKDGSISVDKEVLDTLMSNDGSQGAGISVVRIGQEGRPDDATDSESDSEKVPHVTLSVDSYYDEPNSIVKYDSGADMLQSLRIETRENSLVGFQNDHCYTPLTSPSQTLPPRRDSFSAYEETEIDVKQAPPKQAIPSSKKITILEQQIIPRGKKIIINPSESSVILKGNDILNRPLPGLNKFKTVTNKHPVCEKKSEAVAGVKPSLVEEKTESSSTTSSESINDRDSDSDYKDGKEKTTPTKNKQNKVKHKNVKKVIGKKLFPKDKLHQRSISKSKSPRSIIKQEIKHKLLSKSLIEKRTPELSMLKPKDGFVPSRLEGIPIESVHNEHKDVQKSITKVSKKEKKTPSHVTALLSDMTSLFSTPDVIRRVSTDSKLTPKTPTTPGTPGAFKRNPEPLKSSDIQDQQVNVETKDNYFVKMTPASKTYVKNKEKTVNPTEKIVKDIEPIPQIDDASLAQILQDAPVITTSLNNAIPAPIPPKDSFNTNTMNSPNLLVASLAGPLSPTLDLLAGLQPEEEGLTEDLLMHVAQLVESSDNLKEVLDKQVLGKVDVGPKLPSTAQFHQVEHPTSDYSHALGPKIIKPVVTRKDAIEIIRRDGRIITLPPIEAPATRASKRKSQGPLPIPQHEPVLVVAAPVVSPDPQALQVVAKQYSNKKSIVKKPEVTPQITESVEKLPTDSEDSWNSEDDPNRLWCICKQPHNNRFMICCDKCEDWFHGKCVNITKAMGHQMEQQGSEWTCPNCLKMSQTPKTPQLKSAASSKRASVLKEESARRRASEGEVKVEVATGTSCIVCKNAARASSIYCSDGCILKHAQDSLSTQATPPRIGSESDLSSPQHSKTDSRVIVFERQTGRCLAGPNAPTPENLKSWLQKNPTFEVVRRGSLGAAGPMASMKKLPTKQQPSQGKPPTHKMKQSQLPIKQFQAQAKQPQPQLKQLLQPKQSPTQVKPLQKVQTTLKFERQPKQAILLQPQAKPPPVDSKPLKVAASSTQDEKPKPPLTPKLSLEPKVISQKPATVTPKIAAQSPKTPVETKKSSKLTLLKSPTSTEKLSLKSPPTPVQRKKERDFEFKPKANSTEPIRGNVRKALHEQMSLRMKENTGPKFTEDEIKEFAMDTEAELYELFKDVGIKYKAKYRSLMFNIKDRKNLSLWDKICDKTITPKQLVRLSPEELASQELAQWRDKEVKYQLELIKKSELDLLAASKTYVLKTHKGEEVMETQTSVSTELDPNVPVEDVVTALNDSSTTAEEERMRSTSPQSRSHPRIKIKIKAFNKLEDKDKRSRSRNKKDKGEKHTKSRKNKKSSKDKEGKKDRSRSSQGKEKQHDKSTSRSEMRESRAKSKTKDRANHSESDSLERLKKSKSPERSKHRSPSRAHSKQRSRSRSRRRSRARDKSKHQSPLQERTIPRSQSRGRSRHRSRSRDKTLDRSKKRFHSKYRTQSQEKVKHRSLSEENDYHNKDAFNNSDLIERPKSAMLKEIHPEYDPHEPMITSAFSEEDLRKSREDIYDDTYGNENMIDATVSFKEYDPSKIFSIDTSLRLSTSSLGKSDKIPSEAESDQEPSSTVDSTAIAVWNGCINMVDVARFYVAAHEVSGCCAEIEEELNAELDIVGRINPDTVWEYITKMKRTGNKDIVVLRLTAANDEERMQYIALYSYLSSRNRLGVVKVSNTMTVKDFYILPLAANAPVPPVLLPFDGPGFEDSRNHLLVGVIVRQRKKRVAPPIPTDVIPAKVSRGSRTRSYTPPVSVSGGSYTPPSSPRRRAAQLAMPYASPALSTSVKDKIAASLASAEDEQVHSPSSSSSASSVGAGALRTRMEELKRQIQEEKQQIRKMTLADSSVHDDDEAYSPSRPMTPPSTVPLSDISLPSNLQEILASIQQRTGDVDMRRLPPAPPDPQPAEVRRLPTGSLHSLSEEELLRMVPDVQDP